MPAQASRPAPRLRLVGALFCGVCDRRMQGQEIGKWITDAKAQRLQAETDLRQATSKTTMTRQQIQDLIEECVDIAADLRDAEPATWPGPTASSR